MKKALICVNIYIVSLGCRGLMNWRSDLLKKSIKQMYAVETGDAAYMSNST